jgi:hypothetical protein
LSQSLHSMISKRNNKSQKNSHFKKTRVVLEEQHHTKNRMLLEHKNGGFPVKERIKKTHIL